MAAALAGRLLGTLVEAESAGINAGEDAAQPEAMNVMQELYGIDMSHHIPRDLRDVPLDSYNYLVAMNKSIASLLKTQDSVRQRILVWTVDDPYGKGKNAYERCANQIDALVRKLSSELNPPEVEAL